MDVRKSGGVGVRDRAAGVQLEDVRHPHGVRRRRLLHVLRDGQELAGLDEEPLPAGGERHMPGVPDEQLCSELLLQLPDLLGQGGLAQVQLGGGAPEVQLVGDRHEVAHQPQVQLHVGPPWSPGAVGAGGR